MADVNDRYTGQEKAEIVLFFMPLALANDRQLQNVTVLILPYYDLDILLLVEFIRDFRRPGVFRTNQD